MSSIVVRLHGEAARQPLPLPQRPVALAQLVHRAALSPAAWERLAGLVVAAPVIAMVAALGMGSPPSAGVLLLLGWCGPIVWLLSRRNRRRYERASAAPDLLRAWARHLRGGGTAASFAATSGTATPEVLRDSLRRVGTALDLGAPPERALDELLDIDDLDELATARLALEFAFDGGQHASALEAAAESLALNLRLNREVHALTAQARLSAQTMIVLPIGFVGIGALAGADQMGALFSTSIGRWCLGTGLALDACGSVWLTRMTKRVVR